jgi:hypothetical protein
MSKTALVTGPVESTCAVGSENSIEELSAGTAELDSSPWRASMEVCPGDRGFRMRFLGGGSFSREVDFRFALLLDLSIFFLGAAALPGLGNDLPIIEGIYS